MPLQMSVYVPCATISYHPNAGKTNQLLNTLYIKKKTDLQNVALLL